MLYGWMWKLSWTECWKGKEKENTELWSHIFIKTRVSLFERCESENGSRYPQGIPSLLLKLLFLLLLFCVKKIIFYLFIFHERIHTSIYSSIHCCVMGENWERREEEEKKEYHRIMFLWMRNFFVSQERWFEKCTFSDKYKSEKFRESSEWVREWRKSEKEENHKKENNERFSARKMKFGESSRESKNI